MATTPFDHDKEDLYATMTMFEFEPPLECPCRDLTSGRTSQHLDNCARRFNTPPQEPTVVALTQLPLEFQRQSLDGDVSDHNSTDLNEVNDVDRRRKHRESMARLRQKMRSSIANLQVQERQLQRNLRRTMTAYIKSARVPAGRQAELQAAYFALVEEQKSLESERQNLETTDAGQSKYERLVRRELERLYQNGSDVQKDGAVPPDSD